MKWWCIGEIAKLQSKAGCLGNVTKLQSILQYTGKEAAEQVGCCRTMGAPIVSGTLRVPLEKDGTRSVPGTSRVYYTLQGLKWYEP